MPDGSRPWRLEGFLERLDQWIATEAPSADLRFLVTEWVMTRYDDPYHGVRREKGFANLWFGKVPNSVNDVGEVVVCSYWIEESTHTVRCDSVATLNLAL